MTDDTQASAPVSIGELARRTGLEVRTIRFYCDEGILESRRSAGGHRIFDGDSATERLLLVRRLRALGLGLASITDVLHGVRPLAEAIAAESARVDSEFRSLTWRRASLRAVEDAPETQRDQRLVLLAAVQDGDAAYECLVRFWQRILAPVPRDGIDMWVCWNVPEPPEHPSVEEIVAYAELTASVSDPGMSGAVRQQYWRDRPELIRDRPRLYFAVGEVANTVVPFVAEGVTPRPGDELDRFVHAHASARGERDSPQFRRRLLSGATDSDHRIHRHWSLTGQFFGPRVTVGRAHHWLYEALAESVGGSGNPAGAKNSPSGTPTRRSARVPPDLPGSAHAPREDPTALPLTRPTRSAEHR